MQHTAYLALGTNMGDRMRNLAIAIESLLPPVDPLLASSIYATTPWGFSDQPDFLNMVLKVGTDLTPHQLLYHAKGIEKKLDRQPTFRYGPRPIDIDIIFYDNVILKTEKLTIPHARLQERAFVLVPLCEIAPNLKHPGLKLSVRDMLQGLNQEGISVVALPPAVDQIPR